MDQKPELADAVITDLCHLRIPSLPDWIQPTVDYLVQRARQCGAIDPARTNRLMVSLHEALTNAVIHGNLGISSELKESDDAAFIQEVARRCADPTLAGRGVEVRATFDGVIARWTLADQGAGFDHEAALRRLDEADPDPLKPSGRGLMMMRAFMDELRYEDRGRRLTMTMRRGSASEKRAQPRNALSRGVHVAPIDEAGEVDWSAGHDALLRNVSPEGVALLQAQPVPTGRVLITIPTAGEPIAVAAEVRHWQEMGDRVIEVGCRFERPVAMAALGIEPVDDESTHAVARLVQRLSEQQRPDSERRIASRVPYTEAIGVEAVGQPSVRGFARDLSRSGISFFTTACLPLDVVTLSLPAGDESSLRLRAQVVRCTRLVDGFYDVGASFVTA